MTEVARCFKNCQGDIWEVAQSIYAQCCFGYNTCSCHGYIGDIHLLLKVTPSDPLVFAYYLNTVTQDGNLDLFLKVTQDGDLDLDWWPWPVSQGHTEYKPWQILFLTSLIRGPRLGSLLLYGLPSMRPWRKSSCCGSFSNDKKNSPTSFSSCVKSSKDTRDECKRQFGETKG